MSYYLTVDELTGQLPAHPRESVSTRRALHAEYESFTIPDFWVGEPARLPLQPQDADVTEVTGIAVSPGIAEGIARVMAGPDSGDLDDGEILVCRTTDPSWASLFLVAGGLVIDIGGQISHGAIVAREMGIPCIINTRNGTTAIRTGDRIRVDGRCGTATILEDPRRGDETGNRPINMSGDGLMSTGAAPLYPLPPLSRLHNLGGYWLVHHTRS